MGYTITVRVTDATNSGFTVAEKNVWHNAGGGSWSDNDSIHTLVMGNSGTSGMLCFKNGAGEKFLVVLGIHNYVRWCDIVTDLGNEDTGTKIQSEYYESDTRDEMLWAQLDQILKKSAKGTTVDVKYIKESGNSFVVKLLISS